MRKFASRLARAGLVSGLALALGAPALALEHEVVIDHETGLISADYTGSVTIETEQVGTVSAPGRPSTLACRWTASLSVERVASVGESLNSRRTMSRDNVAGGTRRGWCDNHAEAIERLVDQRNDDFRSALLALVELDRAELLAEAQSTKRSAG